MEFPTVSWGSDLGKPFEGFQDVLKHSSGFQVHHKNLWVEEKIIGL